MRHRPWKTRLSDMKEAISKIISYCSGLSSETELFKNPEKLDACIRNFQVLGDAAARIPPAIRKEINGIPWREITAMRNSREAEAKLRTCIFVIAGLIWSTLSLASAPCADYQNSSEMVESTKIGPFTYKMSYDPDTDRGRLKIIRRGKVVYSQVGSHFYINTAAKCGDLPKAGASITGKRRRELVVVNWTGGAHCCYTLSIIALEDQPFLIQEIELEHSWPDFKDLNKDGILELLISDWTFAYWKIPFAQSPAPQITLGFNGRRWVFEPRWNKKARPSPNDFLASQAKIKQAFVDTKLDASLGDREDTGAPVLLWTEMLNLIYSGNADLALKLFDSAWPADSPHKKKFQCEFGRQLGQSPFFEDLRKINQPDTVPLNEHTDCSTSEK